MTDAAADTPNTHDNTPLDTFSQCHAGILSHLRSFAELPALLDPAARARQVAADMLGFFRGAVFEHHVEEERDLFPAVLASARPGDELAYVQAITDRLTREHRQVEAAWARLEPARISTRRSPQAGDWVMVLGTSYRAQPTQSVGTVAFRHREPRLPLLPGYTVFVSCTSDSMWSTRAATSCAGRPSRRRPKAMLSHTERCGNSA